MTEPTEVVATAVDGTLRELDADSIRDAANLPALAAQSPVERVSAALSDREWDDVEDGHIGGTVQPRLPRLLLNRKTGQEESGFVDELVPGESFTGVHFVWLADTMTRAWWPLEFGKGDKAPACRSRDAKAPDPQSPAQQPGFELPADARGVLPASECAQCPNAKWIEGEGSACAASVEVMVYLLEQQRLSLIRFGGMAVSRVNKYLGALEAHVPRKVPMAYITRCDLEPIKTDNGTFLVPKFSVAGELPRVGVGEQLIALRREKVAEWQEQLAADLAEGAARDSEPSADAGPFDGPPTPPAETAAQRKKRHANEEDF